MPSGIFPRISEAVGKCPGLSGRCITYFDDRLLYGERDTYSEAVADHDHNTRTLQEKCRLKNLKLDKDKLKLRLSHVWFNGHIISLKGLKHDLTKVDAIQQMPTPTNKQEVRRLIGTMNYLPKFALHFSEVIAPIRELLKETTYSSEMHSSKAKASTE